MPGLENQEWWVQEFFYPRGNSPHPSSCSQEVDMSYGWATNLDRYTKLKLLYTLLYLLPVILMLSILCYLKLKRPS